MKALTAEQTRVVDFRSARSPERVGELLRNNVVLGRPLSKPLHGIAAVRLEVARLQRFLPDLRADLTRRYIHPDEPQQLVLESELTARIDSAPVRWTATDVFTLRGHRTIERITHFDPPPVAAATLRHPEVWPRWAGSREARHWRSGTWLAYG